VTVESTRENFLVRENLLQFTMYSEYMCVGTMGDYRSDSGDRYRAMLTIFIYSD